MGSYSYQTKPVCPQCGYEIRAPWELFTEMEQETEVDCGGCEEPFTIRREVTFYYSAKAIVEVKS